MLWQATSRHQEQLLSLASVATSQQTGTAGKSHPWGKIHQPLSSFSHPFSNLPASTFMWISAHHLHLDTQKPLCSAQQDVSFFSFLFFFQNTSYLPVQKVTTVYSIDVVFNFDFHSSDAQLPPFPSLRPSVLDTHLTIYRMREKCLSLQQSHCLFVCLLLGT